MRQASPAALRLSVWAYAHLLRAHPASFRAEFGASSQQWQPQRTVGGPESPIG